MSRQDLSWWRRLTPVLLIGVLAAAGCTGKDDVDPVIVQPGAPGEPARVLDDPPEVDTPPHTAADVDFVRAMIAHHEQALTMASLVADRTGREDLPLFARRIEISQEDEIALMQGWLDARGEAGTAGDPHDHAGDLMPGMLTEEQVADLTAARGADFDRLFLELMIYHHEGALTMVDELLAGGGGQEPELYQMLSHIDADQRIEIKRMWTLLAGMPDS